MSLMDPCGWQRFAHRLHVSGVPMVPAAISYLIRLLFSGWLPHTASIGRGTTTGYGGLGVVIHRDARIGTNVEIGQNVTIGGNHRDVGVPVIEDDVCLSCGCKILGPITIGRGAVVGANAVVVRDVAPYSVVGGVPARVLREDIEPKEFLQHRRNNPRYQYRPDKKTARE